MRFPKTIASAIMMFITAIFYLLMNIYGIYNWMKTSRIEKAKLKGELAS